MDATKTYPWEVSDAGAVVRFDQQEIDRAFDDIVTPAYASSGWVCSLTIECGTLICACR